MVSLPHSKREREREIEKMREVESEMLRFPSNETLEGDQEAKTKLENQ